MIASNNNNYNNLISVNNIIITITITTTIRPIVRLLFSIDFRYTIVLLYYSFSLLLSLLLRPAVSHKLCKSAGAASIYAALYFLPVLTVCQAVFGGLICKLVQDLKASLSILYFVCLENHLIALAKKTFFVIDIDYI